MLKCTLIGRLGADATVRYHNDQQAITFSVVHNEKYKDKNGVKHEKSVWANCVMWRGQDTTISKYLTKGLQVYLEGIPGMKTYTTKEGHTGIDFSIRVDKLEFLGSVNKETEPSVAVPAGADAPWEGN